MTDRIREQPAAAAPVRHTADTITDDELDALYDALAQAEATRRVWQGTANRCATQATKQQARADKAARATDLLAEQYRALEEQLATFKAQLLIEQQRLTRVRALHQRWDASPGDCAHCVTGRGDLVPWPCPTIQALDTTEPTP